MPDETYNIKVKGTVDPKLERDLKKAARFGKETDKSLKDITRSAKNVDSRGVRKLGTETKKTSMQVARLRDRIKGSSLALKIFGTVGAIAAARGLLQISDAYSRVQGRIGQFEKNIQRQNVLFKEFQRISVSVGVSIDRVSEAYSKFNVASKRFGLGVEDSTKVIEGFGFALRAAGENMDRLPRVIATLAESFTKLENPVTALESLLKRGVSEQVVDDFANRILKLAEVDLDKYGADGVSALTALNRAFRDGQLTVDQFYRAFVDLGLELQRAGGTVTEVGHALDQLGSALTNVVGDLFTGTGGTTALAGAISELALALERARPLLVEVGKILGAVGLTAVIGLLTKRMFGLVAAIAAVGGALSPLLAIPALAALVGGGLALSGRGEQGVGIGQGGRQITTRGRPPARVATQGELLQGPQTFQSLARGDTPTQQQAKAFDAATLAFTNSIKTVQESIGNLHVAFAQGRISIERYERGLQSQSGQLDALELKYIALVTNGGKAVDILDAIRLTLVQFPEVQIRNIADQVKFLGEQAEIGHITTQEFETSLRGLRTRFTEVLNRSKGVGIETADFDRALQKLIVTFADADVVVKRLSGRDLAGTIAEFSERGRAGRYERTFASRGLVGDLFRLHRSIDPQLNRTSDLGVDNPRSAGSGLQTDYTTLPGIATEDLPGEVDKLIESFKRFGEENRYQIVTNVEAAAAWSNTSMELEEVRLQLEPLADALAYNKSQYEELENRARITAEAIKNSLIAVLEDLAGNVLPIVEEQINKFGKTLNEDFGDVLGGFGSTFSQQAQALTNNFEGAQKTIRESLKRSAEERKKSFSSGLNPLGAGEVLFENVEVTEPSKIAAVFKATGEGLQAMLKSIGNIGLEALATAGATAGLIILQKVLQAAIKHAEIFQKGLASLAKSFNQLVDVIGQSLAPALNFIGYLMEIVSQAIQVLTDLLRGLWNAILIGINLITFGLLDLQYIDVDHSIGELQNEEQKRRQQEADKRDIDKLMNLKDIKANTDELLELENSYLRAALAQAQAVNQLQRIGEGTEITSLINILQPFQDREKFEETLKLDRENQIADKQEKAADKQVEAADTAFDNLSILEKVIERAKGPGPQAPGLTPEQAEQAIASGQNIAPHQIQGTFERYRYLFEKEENRRKELEPGFFDYIVTLGTADSPAPRAPITRETFEAARKAGVDTENLDALTQFNRERAGQRVEQRQTAATEAQTEASRIALERIGGTQRKSYSTTVDTDSLGGGGGIRIVNIVDPEAYRRYLQSEEGGSVIVNKIREDSESVRAVLQ